MKNYLKTYTVELTTLAPVFIGSGQQLGKKEYVYDKYNKKVWIFDTQNLYRNLSKEKLKNEYEKYMLWQNTDLYTWMQENKISEAQYNIWSKYCLDCSYSDLPEKNKDIALFIKDAYGLPYIPGSSLKGAIRTALIGNNLSQSYQIRQWQSEVKEKSRARSRKKLLYDMEEKSKQIEKKVICDEFSGLRISDSNPLKTTDLILCQKIDKNIDGKNRIQPIFRECLKPGIKIYFDMTIDESICHYKKEDLLNAIQYFFNNANKQYQKYGVLSPNKKNVITVGGGAGYISKTILYNMYPDEMAIQIVSKILQASTPVRHGHKKDTEKGVSPHTLKITKYGGRTYQFGQCEIKITQTM